MRIIQSYSEPPQEVQSTTALMRQGTVVFTWKRVFLVLKNKFLLIYEISDSQPFRTGSNSLIEIVFLKTNWKVDALKFFSVTGKDQGLELHTSHPSQCDRLSRLVFCLPDSEHWVVLLSEAIHQPPALSPRSHSLPDFSKPLMQLSVCSYNLNFALCSLENIGEEERLALNAIRLTNADVVCLQETTQDWELYLQPRMQALYPFSHFDHSQLGDEQKPLAGGIAIFSKYPIEIVKIIPSPCKWFPAQLALISTPLGDCQILNLHLRPPLSQNALPTPSAYFESKEDRLLECLFYATFLQPQQPMVVCGDFNEDYKDLRSHFFIGAFSMSTMYCAERRKK